MRPNLTHWLAVTLLLAPVGCTPDEPIPEPEPGPYEAVPLEETLDVAGLSAPVDVVRDIYGVPHISGASVTDVAFANGWIVAADRMPQMELMRHMVAGRVAELFGVIDPSVIDLDLEMRMHGMWDVAEQVWNELEASAEPEDQELVEIFQRFADGVNYYLAELDAGEREIDPGMRTMFPKGFAPWSPVDSLAVGRMLMWSIAHDHDKELRLTSNIDRARAVFDAADPATDPELARRAGLFRDFFAFRPLADVPTSPGFPENTASATVLAGAFAGPASGIRRPAVPAALLDNALRTLSPKKVLGFSTGTIRMGSNNWVVSGDLTGASPIIAGDPHLLLSNPPVLWLVHLYVPGDLDIAGVAVPGVPGVLFGHNADVAWMGTSVRHDNTDYYLEEIHPCAAGSGDCVTFNGEEVAVEKRTETFGVGGLGAVTGSFDVEYEYVPHHGPIVPIIEDHAAVPRTDPQAISVRYTGYVPTHDERGMYRLWYATSVEEGVDAVGAFEHGGANWVFADSGGNIGWTTKAKLPWRSADCFSYDGETAPDGVAPFLVLPADGSCEWEGWMNQSYMPTEVNPDWGFLATANSDPVGVTFEGDPLSGPTVDGRPLYLGAIYDGGLRMSRISGRIETLGASGAPLTMEDMGDLQADTHSNFGEVMRPHAVAAAEALAEELAAPGTHSDLADWALGLAPDEATRLAEAAARLDSWSLETPPAVEGTPSMAEIEDSVATTIFNVWMVELLHAAFLDELGLVDPAVLAPAGDTYLPLGITGYFELWLPRTLEAVFERPGELATGIAPETGDPVLCDDLNTPATVESCRLVALMALHSALEWLGGPEGFDTADAMDWRWGLLHTLTAESMLPSAPLNLPPANDPDPLLRNGFPRPGDQYAVSAADPGFDSTDDFTFVAGSVVRLVTEWNADGTPITWAALPGGQTFHRDSPYFRNLMDEYWRHDLYFVAPWLPASVVEEGAGRYRLTSE